MKQYTYIAKKNGDFIGGVLYARDNTEAIHNAMREVKQREGDYTTTTLL